MLEHEWDVRSVDFPLTKTSVVLDIGGYKGRWSREIAERYSSSIYTFEPQDWAVKIAREELQGFSNVQVYDFGLGIDSGKFEMQEYGTDGCTFMPGRSQRQQNGEGLLVAIDSWLVEKKITKIDLVMMNIEGYEFKLIPYMIELGIMQNVKYFMCQFHPNGYDDEDAYEIIRKQMGDIMDVYFDYGIVLMCWKAKERKPAASRLTKAPTGRKKKEA